MFKEVFIKFSLFVVLSSLSACSSNTQNQNTAVGAVTGGVVGGLLGSTIGSGTGNAVAIGAGAIAGALVGGAIGHSMDSSDNSRLNNTMDNNPTYKASSWTNQNTGARFTVIPTSNTMAVKGNSTCRQYRTIAIIGGQKRHAFGVACRQPDGMWQPIES